MITIRAYPNWMDRDLGREDGSRVLGVATDATEFDALLTHMKPGEALAYFFQGEPLRDFHKAYRLVASSQEWMDYLFARYRPIPVPG